MDIKDIPKDLTGKRTWIEVDLWASLYSSSDSANADLRYHAKNGTLSVTTLALSIFRWHLLWRRWPIHRFELAINVAWQRVKTSSWVTDIHWRRITCLFWPFHWRRPIVVVRNPCLSSRIRYNGECSWFMQTGSTLSLPSVRYGLSQSPMTPQLLKALRWMSISLSAFFLAKSRIWMGDKESWMFFFYVEWESPVRVRPPSLDHRSCLSYSKFLQSFHFNGKAMTIPARAIPKQRRLTTTTRPKPAM